MGHFAEALTVYDHALAVLPNSTQILLHRGNVLFELHRYAEALASYDAALVREPGDAMLWNNRGNTLVELGRKQDALASFHRAIQADLSYSDALISRAHLLNN